ncbi:hypothetical protein X802_00790 [Thermococcus guaymasensis DSM 11113]|uniref:Uncharacterized protein n=1 Tax=Thermococcus guaymasensis DSM 11113 TaxID=1432656 RepID=A0A0X1KHZ6_9EURY|nr:hypothetical protein X802_00790 [Thermococcus guaymasensis DSM 11113]
MVDVVDTEKIEKMMEELLEEMKNAKTPEELEALQKKVEVLENLIEAVEGDRDIDKAAQLMDKIGPMMEDIIGPIKDLLAELYNPEKMAAMGKSVADFYKNLVEAGMDKEAALELTKEYMANINVAKTIAETFAGLMKGKSKNVHVIDMPGGSKRRPIVDVEEEHEEPEDEE